MGSAVWEGSTRPVWVLTLHLHGLRSLARCGSLFDTIMLDIVSLQLLRFGNSERECEDDGNYSRHNLPNHDGDDQIWLEIRRERQVIAE